MPQRMPATQTMSTATGLDASQQAAVAALTASAPGAEVICIVRSPGNPHPGGEVILLDKASPQLLEQLSAERYAQQQRADVALMAKRTEATPISTPSSRGSLVKNAPIVNVRGGTPSSAADWRPNWLRPK
jgi:hypothetical protein